MTIEEFELLFRMECRQHKVTGVIMGWMERVDETLAEFCPYMKVITFTNFLLTLDYATVMWIIRHEIAHALDYAGLSFEDWYDDQESAHGESWQRWCKVVGCPSSQFIPI